MAHVPVAERSMQFVQAAARVIAREGEAKATTRRIAAEAGAPLAALHYCFRSKEDLLAQVYQYLSRDYVRALEPIRDGAGLDDVVTEHAHRIWRRMLSEPHEQVTTFEVLLRRYRLTDAGEREAALDINRGMYEGWLSSTVRLFEQGAAASGITLPVSAEIAARLFVAGIDGISMQHLADPDEERSWMLVDALATATVRALGGPWDRSTADASVVPGPHTDAAGVATGRS